MGDSLAGVRMKSKNNAGDFAGGDKRKREDPASSEDSTKRRNIADNNDDEEDDEDEDMDEEDEDLYGGQSSSSGSPSSSTSGSKSRSKNAVATAGGAVMRFDVLDSLSNIGPVSASVPSIRCFNNSSLWTTLEVQEDRTLLVEGFCWLQE